MAIRTFNGNYWNDGITNNKVHKYAWFYHVRFFGKQLFRVKFYRRNFLKVFDYHKTKMGYVYNLGKFSFQIIPNTTKKATDTEANLG